MKKIYVGQLRQWHSDSSGGLFLVTGIGTPQKFTLDHQITILDVVEGNRTWWKTTIEECSDAVMNDCEEK